MLCCTCNTYFSSSLTASADSAEIIRPQAAGSELLYLRNHPRNDSRQYVRPLEATAANRVHTPAEQIDLGSRVTSLVITVKAQQVHNSLADWPIDSLSCVCETDEQVPVSLCS